MKEMTPQACGKWVREALERRGYPKDGEGLFQIEIPPEAVNDEKKFWSDAFLNLKYASEDAPYPTQWLQAAVKAFEDGYRKHLAWEIASEEPFTAQPGGEIDERHPAMILDELGRCARVSLPFEHLLDMEINVDIGVDTGDSNMDYTCNTVPPAYSGECYTPDDGRPIYDEASIVWLAKQQGYKKWQLLTALERVSDDPDAIESPFLRSVAREVESELSILNQMFFFLRVTVREFLCLYAQHEWSVGQKKWPGYLILSENTCCGFYDTFQGSGSCLGIRPEKPVKLPFKFISEIYPDVAYRYSVKIIWDMPDREWTRGKILQCTRPRGVLRYLAEMGLDPSPENP